MDIPYILAQEEEDITLMEMETRRISKNFDMNRNNNDIIFE